MTKLTKEEIDTTSYSESMKKLIARQMVASSIENIGKQIKMLCDAVNKIMSDNNHDIEKKNTDWKSSPDLLSGVDLICMERERQIKEKGYTDEHDDNEIKESLVHAAVCYAIPYGPTRSVYVNTFYPWGEDTFKPTPDNRIKELFKAGALIAAEIDRLQRLKR